MQFQALVRFGPALDPFSALRMDGDLAMYRSVQQRQRNRSECKAMNTPGVMESTEVGTRARLLDAAIHLICKHGVSGTTVEAISRRAGVMKTAIYWHFNNKEGLMAAVVTHAGEAITADLAMVDVQAAPSSCQCGGLGGILEGLMTRRPMMLRVIQAMVSESGSMTPSVANALVALHHRSTLLLSQAFAAVTGNPQVDEEELALSAISLTIGAVWMHQLDPTALSRKKMVNQVQSIIGMCLSRRALA